MDFLKYGIGIDMAMETFDACVSVIDIKQCVIIKSRCSFSNDKKGSDLFYVWVCKNTKLPLPCVYLMEATGMSSLHGIYTVKNVNFLLYYLIKQKSIKSLSD